MADLTVDFAGIKSPNPFWVASGPPSNTAYQAHRAFEAGWGGVVWKTVGDPIVNVSSRYSGLTIGGMRMAGFNNIELISDRSPETNFREIAEVKRRWPHHAVIASLMVDTRERWHEFVKRSADAGADGIELNFGCPHGMCERGMGSAVGQNPEVAEIIVGWVMEAATIPVIVKLTPNITNVAHAARAARRAGANAISLINTINSITNVNLDTLVPEPSVAGKSSHGGYCGPAVKPIALNMVHACAADPEVNLPISGIGGIGTWRDAAEFVALGASTLQVCTAIMHYGFRIVEDMADGLSAYLDSKGLRSLADLRGRAVAHVNDWKTLDLNYRRVARIDHAKCIGCNLCYIACEDGAHQCIDLVDSTPYGLGPGRVPGKPVPLVREADCVGCNLCSIVCPVDGCITMTPVETGAPAMTWEQYQSRLAAGTMEPLPAHS
jgi:dihydropyrimidine dehydrogenase (NAD+) subunit PreA